MDSDCHAAPPPEGLAGSARGGFAGAVLVARLARFAAIAGAGWAGDCALFALLLAAGLPAFAANAASATVAASWVYGASVRAVFRCRGDHGRRLAAWLLCQAAFIVATSWAVAALAHATGMPPLAAKIAVTPATFLANYLAMARIATP
jgi:putative flippase GtrA